MRYIFFGTPEFAAIILEKLISSKLIPIAVITNPDRRVGRNKILTAPPVKFKILNFPAHQGEARQRRQFPIKILQPEKLDYQFLEEIKKFNADFAILAAYGKIIPQNIIDIFPRGIVVVHPSLLPKYRGSTPIQSVILAGEEKTGTTLFLMDEKIDHGPVISNCQLPISNNDTYETFSEKLAKLSADLLIETLPKYLAGKIQPQPQDESQATYTKKFSTEDAFVDLEKESPDKVWRKVRALNPEPGTWTQRDGKRMKILKADLKDGQLIIKKVQFAGEKPRVW